MNRHSSRPRSTGSGVTLTNLIVTTAIIGLLLSSGIPTLSILLANHRADNAYRQLLNLVQFTRLEAVNHQTQAILCPTVNQRDCSNDWTQPLMVFIDDNHDEERNPGETIVRVAESVGKGGTITWRASGSKRYLRFKADGSNGNQNGRLTYCWYQGDAIYARQIIMYRTGRARKAPEQDALDKC